MSLFRLWWVPSGQSPTDGAYVHYPLHLLFAIVALESVRHGCLVVGEDLGVVPDEMRRAMPQYGLYHYKVMLFEKVGGRFRRPDEYLPAALATVTTHDLPTLASYWSGADIELRERLNLYPGEEIRTQIRADRAADREALLQALRETGLAPAHPAGGGDAFTPQLAAALHAYLARSTANLVSLQLEDLIGMSEPVNVPGTDAEYPNWQRKMSLGLEGIATREGVDADHRIPLTPTAAGTICTACARLVRSDSRPISVGEIASPSRWIANTLSAIAEARSSGETMLTSAALIGPVDRKIRNCAMTMYTV
jgi:4-alpha-glucanotransferase